MPTKISEHYWAVLRKHMELGTNIDCCDMTASQKERTKQCLDCFNAICQRSWVDPREYMKNKFGRTEAELTNDMAIINFMLAFRNRGSREIDEYRVRATANRAMQHGAQTGNDDLALKGAALLTKVAGLDRPAAESNEGELLPGASPFTTDVSVAYEGKKRISKAEMKRIRQRYGVVPDEWQQRLEVEE